MKIKTNHLTTFPLVSDWLMFRGQGWILWVQDLRILCCTWVWAGKAVFSIHPQPKRWADLASPLPWSPVKPLGSVWPGVSVPCHRLHSQTTALVSGRLWAGMVVVDGWGSGKACWLPTVGILPKFIPAVDMPVKEFQSLLHWKVWDLFRATRWMISFWGGCRGERSKSLLIMALNMEKPRWRSKAIRNQDWFTGWKGWLTYCTYSARYWSKGSELS